MPSALDSEPPPPPRHDDLDNYNVNFSDDDPFASPPPEGAKKRKEPDTGLGIDEEISVQKRARVPNIKLDEERLLGPAGIPKLRQRAAGLKLKGKGHEFSDASRLLSFYQLWLDDLFPKARFLDALSMVEKAGHKKRLVTARSDWISEGKPRASAEDEEEEDNAFAESAVGGDAAASTSQDDAAATTAPRTQTPDRDIPDDDDDDIYGATPRASVSRSAPTARDDAPDEDDLEALMAEAENADSHQQNTNDNHRKLAGGDLDEADDLDALMAESEAVDRPSGTSAEKGKGSSSGGSAGNTSEQNFADEEEAMQEMEGLW